MAKEYKLFRPAVSMYSRIRYALIPSLVFFSLLPCLTSRADTSPDSAKARVLMLYIDGLRPDTVDEMVSEGKLPMIKKLFYDDGVRFKNFFTVFPSNTVISNAAFMTGKWPSNSGLKTQAFFKRFDTGNEPWYKKIGGQDYPYQINLLASPHKIPPLLKRNKIKALYNYLGEKYHSSLVPITPNPAPMAWPHVAANVVENPLKVTEEAAKHLDIVNASYSHNYMATDTKALLFLVWFPSLDEEQHYDKAGQFGEARRRMEEADAWIRRLYQDLRRNNEKLYVILFSDHGAIGGKDGIYNQPYYLGQDFFYETLKMNVLGPDYSITYPGTNPRAFA